MGRSVEVSVNPSTKERRKTSRHREIQEKQDERANKRQKDKVQEVEITGVVWE